MSPQEREAAMRGLTYNPKPTSKPLVPHGVTAVAIIVWLLIFL